MSRFAQLACGAMLAIAVASGAAGGSDFGLSRDIVAGGGMNASGGSFVLVGTFAEPVTGVQSGGPFHLTGGFHIESARGAQGDAVFRDGFEG